jgi:hypothetical protein
VRMPVACLPQGGPGTRHLRGNLAGLDLEALRADPARLHELPVEELAALLERCGLEHERLAVVERGALALLRERVARQVDPREADGDSFISVKMAAERLGLDVKTIYRRRFPFLRELVPGTWRVSTRALARWMVTRRRVDAG